MDRDNYSFATLPSYLRYSQREIAKHDARSSFTSDSAYTNIRQKISTASISVPYEKGLDHLRVLNISRNSVNSLDNDECLDTTIVRLAPLSKVPKRRNMNLNRQRKLVNINKSDSYTYDLAVPRVRRGSEDGSSVFSMESRQSKASTIRTRPLRDRIGSETSSISSRSRPPSYTSWYTEDSVFSERLDDLKERYSENSEFLASIRRQRLSYNSTESFTKETTENDVKVLPENETKEKLEAVTPEKEKKSPRVKHNERKTKFKIKTSKNSGPINLKPSVLPPIPVSQDEYSTGETTCVSSNSATSISERGHNSVKENKRPTRSKRRKVEFNFTSTKPKRVVRLPPLPSATDHKTSRKPKSILKKQDCSESPSSLSHAKISEEEELDMSLTSVRWQVHLPKLRSPVPLSGGRRQPIIFQRNNLQFKCSKEFEAAAVDEAE